MNKTYTAEEIVNMFNDEIENGKKVNARIYLGHTTDLSLEDVRAISRKQMTLTPDMITNTDFDSWNKPGCTMRSAALLVALIPNGR